MNNESKLENIFREVFEDDQLVINNTMTMDDIENWDSVSHFQLIMEIEMEFEIKFTTAEISSFKNVGELLGIIRRHQEEEGK